MLSNDQKRILSNLARRAFNLEGAKARGRGETWDGSATAEVDWRHAQVGKAVGKIGLRCCDQADYKIVEAHFLALLGETGKAMNALVRSQTNERRQIEHKICEVLATMRKPINYAASTCKQMFRTSLEDASVDQLWRIFYALNKQATKQKKAAKV